MKPKYYYTRKGKSYWLKGIWMSRLNWELGQPLPVWGNPIAGTGCIFKSENDYIFGVYTTSETKIAIAQKLLTQSTTAQKLTPTSVAKLMKKVEKIFSEDRGQSFLCGPLQFMQCIYHNYSRELYAYLLNK